MSSLAADYAVQQLDTEQSYLEIAKMPRKQRRVAAQGKRTYIMELQENHRAMVRMAFQGMKAVDIAEELGMNPNWTSKVLQSDLVKEHLAKMHQAADTFTVLNQEKIHRTASKAHEYLEKVIVGEEKAAPADRIRVASDYVNRAGFAPVSKSQIAVGLGALSQEDISELKSRALSVARQAQSVIDVEPTNANG